MGALGCGAGGGGGRGGGGGEGLQQGNDSDLIRLLQACRKQKLAGWCVLSVGNADNSHPERHSVVRLR